jgi:hypothetical protein
MRSLNGTASRSSSLLRPRYLEQQPRAWTVCWLEVYAGRGVVITRPPSNHSHRAMVPTDFSRTVAPQGTVRYLCGAAFRRSRGAELLDYEKSSRENRQARFSIMRSVASALSVTNNSALSVVCRREIGCNFMGEAMRRRRYAEDRFAVSRRYWSATFNSGPTRLVEEGKQDREPYKGGATARLLGLSRER